MALPRGTRQRIPKSVVMTKENRDRALELRTAGLPYSAIGKAMNLSKSQAARLVEQGLNELTESIKEKALNVRELELRRLDAIVASHWTSRADPKSANVILNSMDRRAKFLGLDAPSRTENLNQQVGPVEVLLNLDALSTEELVMMQHFYLKMEGKDDAQATPQLK